MEKLCIILILIFTMGCSVSDSAIRAEEEKIGEAIKEVVGIAEVKKEIAKTTEKETSKDAEITATPNQSQLLLGQVKRKDVKTKRIAAKKIITTAMAAAEEELMAEITGLVIEQTMTKNGYEFYERFFILWEAPRGIKDYNIFIYERASPLWGSWIQIKINSTSVWNKVLGLRSEEIEEAVKKAVGATKEYLYHYEKYKKELEAGDMLGDGI